METECLPTFNDRFVSNRNHIFLFKWKDWRPCYWYYPGNLWVKMFCLVHTRSDGSWHLHMNSELCDSFRLDRTSETIKSLIISCHSFFFFFKQKKVCKVGWEEELSWISGGLRNRVEIWQETSDTSDSNNSEGDNMVSRFVCPAVSSGH